MSKRTRPPNIPSSRKTQSPQAEEDRSSQAHFSLGLRMEAQRGQSWNSPSLRKAWRCHHSHLPLSARTRASPPGSDLRPRRLSSADCCLAPARLAAGPATRAGSGAFSLSARGRAGLGVKRGLRVPVLRRGGAGCSARTRRGAPRRPGRASGDCTGSPDSDGVDVRSVARPRGRRKERVGF